MFHLNQIEFVDGMLTISIELIIVSELIHDLNLFYNDFIILSNSFFFILL